jgi:3-methyl-2-oxobutanoate hydroxymethyltransferase
MLGITQEFKPRFLRRYADLQKIMTEAFQSYIADVKSKDFPNSSESY